VLTAEVRAGLAAAAGGALAAAVPMLSPPDPAPAEAPVVIQPVGALAAVPQPLGAPRMLAALSPVTTSSADEPDLPPEAQISDLVKAAGLADAARAAEEARAEREAREAAANSCDADLHGLGAVKPWVRDVAGFLSCLYDEPTLIGVASRGSGVSDHPRGLAIDLMTGRDQGDRIADCALANRDELGVDYVLWRQRADMGSGWEPMEDRGSPTANHYDHVHISFHGSAPDGAAIAALCH
jgi:hypothetical protein